METEFAAATGTEGICCVALLDDCRVQCAVCSVVALCVSSSSLFFFCPVRLHLWCCVPRAGKQKRKPKLLEEGKKRESDALGK